MGRKGVLVEKVIPGSIAWEVGIETGDRLLAVNGRPVKDILEYRYYTSDELVTIDIEKPDGQVWNVEVEKEYDEDLGLVLPGVLFDRIRTCRNRCLFCFMDQLPRGVRKTLRLKDDDYRLSFLYGNFITLTNLSAKDWEAIITMRLSPLYVSVHATDPAVRAFMLGNEKGSDIISDLKRLQDAGVQVHAQVVLCPGINDGTILDETVSTLAGFWRTVLSIGIVPVGLTRFREGLYPLRPVGRDEAEELIAKGQAWQAEFRNKLGTGLVYLADEFFIKTDREFPPHEYYDDYPQIENGIGMAREFLRRLAELEHRLPGQVEPACLTLVCGRAASGVLERAVQRLNHIKGLKVRVLPVTNNFFGPEVTVTGLLTGADILKALKDCPEETETVVLPDVVLREGREYFLDNMTVEELAARVGRKVQVVEASAEGLVACVGNLADKGDGI